MVKTRTSHGRSPVSPRERWSELIAAQARSGQSISCFCRSHHLTESQYYYWRKRLGSASAFEQPQPAGGFVELREPAHDDTGVWIGLGRLRIGLDPDFDPATLRRLLEALDPS